MNLQSLRYAVEVEKAGSISKAAEKLYMNQPNLSRAIREMESAVGITLFRRTTKGISATTDEGRVFIEYAKSILAKYDDMCLYFQSPRAKKNVLRVAIPRASYISEAFALFVEGMSNEETFDINFMETDSMRVIANVADEGYDFGVIRYHDSYDEFFNSILNEKALVREELLHMDSVIVFSKGCGLAARDKIAPNDLHGMIEIINDDFFTQYRALDGKPPEKQPPANEKQIYVYERGSQFDLLSRIPQAYMRVSPMPKDVLERNQLVQKDYAGPGVGFKDVLIYRRNHTMAAMELAFLEKIEHVKKIVSVGCC